MSFAGENYDSGSASVDLDEPNGRIEKSSTGSGTESLQSIIGDENTTLSDVIDGCKRNVATRFPYMNVTLHKGDTPIDESVDQIMIGILKGFDEETTEFKFWVEYENQDCCDVLTTIFEDKNLSLKLKMSHSYVDLTPFPFRSWASKLFKTIPQLQVFAGFLFEDPEILLDLQRISLYDRDVCISKAFETRILSYGGSLVWHNCMWTDELMRALNTASLDTLKIALSRFVDFYDDCMFVLGELETITSIQSLQSLGT